MDITKLPKWAQEHIRTIERQRETAIRALNEYVDSQTPSPVFIDEMECTGERQGPSIKRRYIQTTRVQIEHDGVRLDIVLRDKQIDLQWGDTSRAWTGEVAFIPSSFQMARLVSKENMK